MLDPFNLVWLEEPTNACDYRGHAQLTARLDTPIATGEMLSSVAVCNELIKHQSVTFLQACPGRVEIRNGQMLLPQRPGLGFALSEEAAQWRVDG